MTVPLSKRRKEFNGYHLDGVVTILTAKASASGELRTIRILGEAGFYVKGLATCFYWLEKGKTWDDVPTVGNSKEKERA
jgi:hypothetical protein